MRSDLAAAELHRVPHHVAVDAQQRPPAAQQDQRRLAVLAQVTDEPSPEGHQREVGHAVGRRDQSVTRTDTPAIEWDEGNAMVKVNPIIEWSNDDVWAYIKANNIPYNKLHDKNYPSIGCAPCTRAIKPGEDIRAGRWWWENPEFKECGLHE